MSDKLTKMIALRCKYCNAALETKNKKQTIIRCESCGTEQKLLEVKEYLNQIRGWIHEWLGSAVPKHYIDTGKGEQIDKAARYNIFVNNVKPKLDTEYHDYKFHSLSFLGNVLFFPPFLTGDSLYKQDESKDIFLFNAKIKSIYPLAVDKEHQNYLNEIDSMSTAYGYLLNNLPFLEENNPDRFHCLANNFKKSAECFNTTESFASLSERFSGLHNIALASDKFLENKVSQAKKLVVKGIASLKEANTKISSDLNLASMSPAVKREISIAELTQYMINTASNLGGNISQIEKLMNFLLNQKEQAPEIWRDYFKNVERYKQIFSWLEKISLAKAGEPAIKIVGKGGAFLFPFWVVDLPYTFSTGSLWMKKNPEVHETMLLSALFTSDENLLSANYTNAVTDIFSRRQSDGFFKDLSKSITGKETSISTAGPIHKILQIATKSSASGKIFPTLSTKEEAKKMVDLYIDETKKHNSFVYKKFNFCQSRIVELLFIYGDIKDDNIILNVDLDGLAPKNIGDLDVIQKIYV